MIKKFCTKHGVEYFGDACPECTSDTEAKSVETKVEMAPRKKTPKPKRKNTERDVHSGSYDDKLKALMDKWNGNN